MNRQAIITGASSGLGFESAKALADAGFDLTLIARGADRLIEKADFLRRQFPNLTIREIVMDVSNLDQVREFASHINFPVDILMNNAGLMGPDFALSIDGIESQMATNHVGHFLLTSLLWKQLEKANDPRVISLSSVVHRKGKIYDASIEEIRGSDPSKYDRWQRYANSKLACLYFARELDLRSRTNGSRVRSIAAHPGWAITGLQDNFPHVLDPLAQDAKTGARSQVFAALDDSVESGDFVGPNFELWGKPKKLRGSRRSRRLEISKALWETSEELTGTNFL
jgi:NAD(P)-dependent dehydrogenase (short-subunit alcohol dehydrogenase family)